ncbi:uncharacterized protein LOC141678393 isoform X2 [Apium graveolens]|uniref:uncharacterized protein LOC141678393 isoform X2 n=1 Tax=Apium graveolens TaxID=4045 RepID=UPI003D7ABFA0
MDYDDNDSQGHNLAGEENSQSSPVSRPFSLPNFDFEDSLPGHLRFESLVENEVFLGISSQEDSQWIEDFSRGNSGIEFSTSATEPCSISRHNNVWSEATSSESVAMLLKSVGQEERIQGETLILESETGNEFGRLTTEMEPNLKQDDKFEDITDFQPTASPDSFLDGRNVSALESKKDNLPVDGSSAVVPNVSNVMSKVDVGSDDTNQLEVNNIEQPQLDNLEGLPAKIHVRNVTSVLPTDMAGSNQLNGEENKHQVSNTCFETADGLLNDIPQQIMVEQNICRTESSRTGSATCTRNMEFPDRISISESLGHNDETNITSINEPLKLQEKLTCDLQIKEAGKIDKGFMVPSQLGNVEVGACNKGENICKPLQDFVSDSSMACLDAHTFDVVNKDAGNSACSGLEISIVEEMEKSCGDQANSLESENLEVFDIKMGNSSCPEHDKDSFVENETSENYIGGAVVAEAFLLPDRGQANSLESENLEVVDMKTGNSSCPEHDKHSFVENETSENHIGGAVVAEAFLLPDREQANSLESENLEVVDMKTENSSCPEHDKDSFVENETSENHMGGAVVAEAFLLPDREQANSLESENLEVVDMKTGNSSCLEHDKDSFVENETSENHMGGVVVAEAFLLPDREAANSLESENLEVVDMKMGNSSCPEHDKDSFVENETSENHMGGAVVAEAFLLPDREQANSLESENLEVVDMKTGHSSCPEHDKDFFVENETSENHMGGAVVAEAFLLPDREQANSLESENVEVVDMKTGNSSCPEHDKDSFIENETSENHMGGAVVAEAFLFPDREQGEGRGVKHVRNPDISLSGTVSGSQCEKQLSSKDLSNLKTSIVLEDNNTAEAQNSFIVVGGHVQLSKSNLSSEQEDVQSFEKDVCSHEREDAKSPTQSVCPDEFNKANLVHGSEFLNSLSNVPGLKVTEEMNLSLCDTPTDPLLLSKSKTPADGVALSEQEQNSQVANLLGITNSAIVATDLEPGITNLPIVATDPGPGIANSPIVATNLEPGLKNSPKVAIDLESLGIPETGQASCIEQETGPGCSTEVKASPVLNSSDVNMVEDTAPAACESNEEVLVTDAVLLSSQSVVPPESVSVSIVESYNMILNNHEVIVTSGTQLTEIPSTKVDSPEKNQDSVALACLSKHIADSVNKDGDASAHTLEENVFPPSVISCVKSPPSENEQQRNTKEVSIGTVPHPATSDGAGGMVQSVSLHVPQDSSNNGESSIFEVSLSTGLSDGETIKDLQLYPLVQVHRESTDVKESPSERNPDPPSVVGCANIPSSETGQKSRAEGASVATSHSEGTPDAGGGKVQSDALHMHHDNSNEGKIISIENVEGYPLASDCSLEYLTMVPGHCHEISQGPGPMSGKKRDATRGTSERKPRQGSAKTSARSKAKKRGVQEIPVKQFEGDKSTVILNSPGTSNSERNGKEPRGALPTPTSNIPDLNTSVMPAYCQQPFTDPQQVQLRAQILVHGSLMQNSVPEEACMISAFGPLDGGGSHWEPSWRACGERICTEKSHASNLETPVRLHSGSQGPDQPVRNSSHQSKTPLPDGGASSKGIPSPVVNPTMPLSSPLWNVSTPCDGLQSSGLFVDFHQPFAPLQPYQSQGTGVFVEQSPSWLSQTHFPGQWVATPQNSDLNVNANVSSMFCTELVTLAPSKVSSVPNHPGMKHSTGGGGVSVSSGTPQTDVNKVSIPSGQNSRNTKYKKRKKVSNSMSPPGHMLTVTLDQAASVSDTSNHLSKKAKVPWPDVQSSLLALSMTETGSPVVNNLSSTPNAAATTLFASTGHSGSPLILSDQSTKVDRIVENKSRISDKTLIEVEAAKVQAEDAAAHAAAAVGNCNDVWSQLSKLKNSGLRFDDETKLSSAAMAIAAAASVAKAAAAAAKLASDVAIGAKLMADEVSATSITENSAYSTEISLSHSSITSLFAGEGNVSARSIIAAAKETVKKRVEAATAASKHAENLEAVVKAAELASEAVSQAGKIVSIGDHLPLSELVSSGPMDYWRSPQVSPEQGKKSLFGQWDMYNSEKLVQAERPKDGAVIMREAVKPGTVTSIGMNSSTTDRGNSGGPNPGAVTSCDAHRIATGTSFENGIMEGCLVEVFKEGGKFKAAWYLAKILNLNREKAFVSYTELQAEDGSGKLKEWVPLKGDGLKAPTIRIPHPTTSTGFDRTRKRRREAVVDYTWCVGDKVDAWMKDCWFEGVVKEKKKNDETMLTIYIPVLGGTSAVKIWNLRPTVTWQDGKWIECPTATVIDQSITQGDTPKEKRVKLGYPAIEAAKEDEVTRDTDLVKSKELEEPGPLPLLANETEYNIGNNTGDVKLDAPRVARTGLQKEGSRVVFGVPKPGKKRKFMDVSKHLDSDQSSKNKKASDSIKTARYLPQGPGGRSWNNNTHVNIKEKQAAEEKSKVFKSVKTQSVSGRVLPQKVNSSVSAKSVGKVMGKEENSSAQQNLMDFGSVSNSQDTSERPTSSKGLSKVPCRRVPSSYSNSVQMDNGKLAAAEPRRSSRKIQPTSRLLEGLQSSLIGSKIPSLPHEKNQRNLNKG